MLVPKGPKYLYGTRYGFCSGNVPYGLGKDSPYGYLGRFGCANSPERLSSRHLVRKSNLNSLSLSRISDHHGIQELISRTYVCAGKVCKWGAGWEPRLPSVALLLG